MLPPNYEALANNDVLYETLKNLREKELIHSTSLVNRRWLEISDTILNCIFKNRYNSTSLAITNPSSESIREKLLLNKKVKKYSLTSWQNFNKSKAVAQKIFPEVLHPLDNDDFLIKEKKGMYHHQIPIMCSATQCGKMPKQQIPITSELKQASLIATDKERICGIITSPTESEILICDKAYTLQARLKIPYKTSALALKEDRIIVGTECGKILFYGIQGENITLRSEQFELNGPVNELSISLDKEKEWKLLALSQDQALVLQEKEHCHVDEIAFPRDSALLLLQNNHLFRQTGNSLQKLKLNGNSFEVAKEISNKGVHFLTSAGENRFITQNLENKLVLWDEQCNELSSFPYANKIHTLAVQDNFFVFADDTMKVRAFKYEKKTGFKSVAEFQFCHLGPIASIHLSQAYTLMMKTTTGHLLTYSPLDLHSSKR